MNDAGRDFRHAKVVFNFDYKKDKELGYCNKSERIS